jgi:hypothetical protein
MGHPDYVYQPQSEARRAAARERAMVRIHGPHIIFIKAIENELAALETDLMTDVRYRNLMALRGLLAAYQTPDEANGCSLETNSQTILPTTTAPATGEPTVIGERTPEETATAAYTSDGADGAADTGTP